jgi:hypothetical protein
MEEDTDWFTPDRFIRMEVGDYRRRLNYVPPHWQVRALFRVVEDQDGREWHEVQHYEVQIGFDLAVFDHWGDINDLPPGWTIQRVKGHSVFTVTAPDGSSCIYF